jgi:hypothetical protein
MYAFLRVFLPAFPALQPKHIRHLQPPPGRIITIIEPENKAASYQDAPFYEC